MKKLTSAERKRSIANGWVDAAGRPVGEDTWIDSDGMPTDEDGNYLPTEIVSEETFDTWRDCCKELAHQTSRNQWAIGEIINEGELLKECAGLGGIDQRGKNGIYKAASDILGLSISTLKDYAFVVRNVPKELHEEFQVSFSHLKLVAKSGADIEKQRDFLRNIQICSHSVNDAREMIRIQSGTPKAAPKTAAPKTAAPKTAGPPTAADKHAQSVIEDCDRVMEDLKNDDLALADFELQIKMQSKVLEMYEELRKELERWGLS